MGESEDNAAKSIVLRQSKALAEAIEAQVNTAPAAMSGNGRCTDHGWVVTAAKLSLQANGLTLQLLIVLVESGRPAMLAASGAISGVTAGVLIGAVEAVKYFLK